MAERQHVLLGFRREVARWPSALLNPFQYRKKERNIHGPTADICLVFRVPVLDDVSATDSHDRRPFPDSHLCLVEGGEDAKNLRICWSASNFTMTDT